MSEEFRTKARNSFSLGNQLGADLFVRKYLVGGDLGIVFANPHPHDSPHIETGSAGCADRQPQTAGEKNSICSRTGH